jgi:hypothetical protein
MHGWPSVSLSQTNELSLTFEDPATGLTCLLVHCRQPRARDRSTSEKCRNPTNRQSIANQLKNTREADNS